LIAIASATCRVRTDNPATAAAPATTESRRNFLLFKLVIYFLQVVESNSCHHLFGKQIDRETIIQLENISRLAVGVSFISTYVARANRNAIEKIIPFFKKFLLFFSYLWFHAHKIKTIWLNYNQNYLAKIAILLPKSENQGFLLSKLPI
jgi:hypothetical protein